MNVPKVLEQNLELNQDAEWNGKMFLCLFSICPFIIVFIFYHPSDKIQSTIDYPAKPDDVFIVGFPKSGTTLTQQIVYLLQNEGQAPANYSELNKKSFFIDLSGANCLSKMERPSALKTHLRFDLTPYNAHAKYIYIARNPFDVCVSFYHFIGSKYGVCDFGTWFEIFIDPNEAIYGDYFDNLLSWWKHRHNSNVLFITYEEMHKAKRELVLRIGTFLDYKLGEKLCKHNNSLMENTLNYSSFEYMKKTIDESYGLWHCDESNLSRDKQEMTNLFRRGEVNRDRETFSSGQISKMNEIFAVKCNGTGLENLWPDIMN